MRKFITFLCALLLCLGASAQFKVVLPDYTPEKIVKHTGYTVSFNEEARIPNYVFYKLSPEDITTEGVSREGEDFVADPKIPGCPETAEYSRTGYDRGHMMPAADCKTSEKRMTESFYLSNVCPQDHVLNEKYWCDLEKQVRFWCKHWYKSDLWIMCGPVISEGSKHTVTGIVIPDAFWKIICRKDKDGSYKAAAFVFKNNPLPQPCSRQRVSVDKIEDLTGIDFFADMNPKEEAVLEKELPDWKF